MRPLLSFAQAIAPGGRLLDAFAETRRVVHVINAPSPAATALLSMGELMAVKVAERGWWTLDSR